MFQAVIFVFQVQHCAPSAEKEHIRLALVSLLIHLFRVNLSGGQMHQSHQIFELNHVYMHIWNTNTRNNVSKFQSQIKEEFFILFSCKSPILRLPSFPCMAKIRVCVVWISRIQYSQ